MKEKIVDPQAAKGLLSEFKDFINQGNVLDMAVGIVVGAAFTAIVTSLVGDIIMPIIGMITGGIDFTALVVTVGKANIAYGKFIQAIINFLLIAFVVFMLVKAVNKMRRQNKADAEAEASEEEAPSAEVLLLTEIRDALKQQQ